MTTGRGSAIANLPPTVEAKILTFPSHESFTVTESTECLKFS
ncbi:MAG: hypothetical protein QNJ47_28630 [Nostocaceae cyanobacterium]|nr:hypothetical protein [Nostocaceae cyanobacterium]